MCTLSARPRGRGACGRAIPRASGPPLLCVARRRPRARVGIVVVRTSPAWAAPPGRSTRPPVRGAFPAAFTGTDPGQEKRLPSLSAPQRRASSTQAHPETNPHPWPPLSSWAANRSFLPVRRRRRGAPEGLPTRDAADSSPCDSSLRIQPAPGVYARCFRILAQTSIRLVPTGVGANASSCSRLRWSSVGSVMISGATSPEPQPALHGPRREWFAIAPGRQGRDRGASRTRRPA